jgi:putative thiazole-containing bacteriocin maturation protein
MGKVHPAMQPKLKRDTFFYYDEKKGVYFRNNVNSFWMEGNTIIQWIEKLLPMLNGENSIHDLTNRLPDAYRKRVYEIIEVLEENDFIRDVSSDSMHYLRKETIEKYASQVEFLDNMGGSGAARFEQYRQTKVLAIGSDSFLLSLVSSLLESGMAKFHVFVTNTNTTNRTRLEEMIVHYQKTDRDISVGEMRAKQFPLHAIQAYDAVLYVSPDGNREELEFFHTLCKQEGKLFIPAICLEGVGLAGPVVNPDSDGCWEKAWRSLHKQALTTNVGETYSTTVGALLSNVLVFELLKKRAGIPETRQKNQLYILNVETLEGTWHTFVPSSFVERDMIQPVKDISTYIKESHKKENLSEFFHTVSSLTSETTGTFHKWEEGDLQQVPLAQFCVQSAQPNIEGPAELLPEIICASLTHTEAQREAALYGMESYITVLSDVLNKDLGIHLYTGAGLSPAEGISRGIQKYLTEELSRKQVGETMIFSKAKFTHIEDKHCAFYLQALSTMRKAVEVGIGKEIEGFPVMCVHTNNRFYLSTALHPTLALRNGLQQAIMDIQNKVDVQETRPVCMFDKKEPKQIIIHAYEESDDVHTLESALELLNRHSKKPIVVKLPLPEVLQKEVVVYGVAVEEANRWRT